MTESVNKDATIAGLEIEIPSGSKIFGGIGPDNGVIYWRFTNTEGQVTVMALTADAMDAIDQIQDELSERWEHFKARSLLPDVSDGLNLTLEGVTDVPEFRFSFFVHAPGDLQFGDYVRFNGKGPYYGIVCGSSSPGNNAEVYSVQWSHGFREDGKPLFVRSAITADRLVKVDQAQYREFAALPSGGTAMHQFWERHGLT